MTTLTPTPFSVRPSWLSAYCGAGALLGTIVGITVTAAKPGTTSAPAGWVMLGVFLTAGIPLAIFDMRHHILPDAITLPLAAFLACITAASSLAAGDPGVALRATLAALAVGFVFFTLGVAGGMGFGDVKLSLAIGLLLGWHSWPAVVGGVVMAYFFAAPYAIYQVARRRKTGGGQRRMAFGPFLIAGAVCVAGGVMLGV